MLQLTLDLLNFTPGLSVFASVWEVRQAGFSFCIEISHKALGMLLGHIDIIRSTGSSIRRLETKLETGQCLLENSTYAVHKKTTVSTYDQ